MVFIFYPNRKGNHYTCKRRREREGGRGGGREERGRGEGEPAINAPTKLQNIPPSGLNGLNYSHTGLVYLMV